jgi:hypothetical protein
MDISIEIYLQKQLISRSFLCWCYCSLSISGHTHEKPTLVEWTLTDKIYLNVIMFVSISIQPQLQMRTLKDAYTPSKDSIEKIKGKREESRNRTLKDAILGRLISAIKMSLLENKSQTMNNNIYSQI